MKDYKYLADSAVVQKAKKRDKGVMIVSVLGSILMAGCWVYFVLALVS